MVLSRFIFNIFAIFSIIWAFSHLSKNRQKQIRLLPLISQLCIDYRPCKCHFYYFLVILFLSLPFVHPIVDEGVDTAVGHGQPIEGQVHVWGVPGKHSCSTGKGTWSKTNWAKARVAKMLWDSASQQVGPKSSLVFFITFFCTMILNSKRF